MPTLEDKIHSRKLEACHIMVASLLSGFSEIGILNQAVVTSITRKIAKHLKAWFDTLGFNPNILPDDPPDIRINKVVTLLNDSLRLLGEIKLNETPNGSAILITSKKCRICPIGVGEAEISGTACPFPGLISNLVKLYSPDGKGIKIIPRDYHVLTKQDGACYLYFGEDK